MNRDAFFTTAKLTRTPIQVNQAGENGYYLSLVVKHEGEEPQMFTLMYKAEPRYFKSLSGVESTLRDQGLFNFSVVMEKQEVKRRTRSTTAKVEVKPKADSKPPQAKADKAKDGEKATV